MKKLLLASALCLAACENEVTVLTSSTTSGGSTTVATSTGVGGEGGSDATKLTIELSPETPPAANVIAGQDSWSVYSAYTVTNVTDTAQTLRSTEIDQVDPNGDAADFTTVALAMDGTVCLVGTQAHLEGKHERFTLTDATGACDMTIAAQSARTVEVWAKTRLVQPSDLVNDAWHGVPRSGHSDMLRVTFLGVESDPADVLQGPSTGKDPKQMVLRKTVPEIVPISPDTTALTGAEQEFLAFRVMASSAGDVGVMEFAPRFKKTGAFEIPSFTLSKDGVLLPQGSYHISVLTEHDVYDASLPAVLEQPGGTILIRFVNEEVVTAAGAVYALTGTATNLAPDDALELKFQYSIKQYGDFRVGTGPIQDPGMDHALYIKAPDADFVGTVTWSDLSETDSLLNQGNSKDWTDDLYLHTLNWSQGYSM